jgi:COP9 signalosome complex subunit 2
MKHGGRCRGFKALKQIVKLHYTLGNQDDMLKSYESMLEYANGAVTRNAAEKKINSTLDFISHSTDPMLLQKFYALTLRALADAQNDRLWFKTSIKLVQLWISLKQIDKALDVLSELHSSCKDEKGEDDSRKGTQLLEVYALQIQLLSEAKAASRSQLLPLYEKALAIKSAIPHPKIMGIIRECGGKMHMHSQNWEQAATDFFEAFKSYDEAGSLNRSRCLKYLVLANMMMESSVDPFDSQEARPYRSDPAVSAMTTLVEAYQSADIDGFEKALKEGNDDIAGDSFVSPYIEDLRRKLCAKAILRLIGPYSRVKIQLIRDALQQTTISVDEILVTLILDKKIDGRIDQTMDILEVSRSEDGPNKYKVLRDFADNIQDLHKQVASKLLV